LEQHQDNPVDWWPWGEEAFAEARRRDVPLFVSIGYATCHWCHVMAHECFEDEVVARLMNDAFVCIKVDREERPDVDDVYMQACQALTGSGGWPLNVVVTHDKEPFYAATYIPRTSRHGRPGMLELVPALAKAWRERRDELARSAREITAALQQHAAPVAGTEPTREVLPRAVHSMAQRYDRAHGGFGGAPKFPSPHQVRFLLRRGEPHARAMAVHTLDAMMASGLRDHVGGGFHRYSTDVHWFLPHFEKMLYDQAGMIALYAEAYGATGNEAYRDVVAETVAYLERDMRHKGGAFFSAEDADSEGEEGLFYTWTHAELQDALGADAAAFMHAYGGRPDGNVHDEATRRPTGRNHLHRAPASAAGTDAEAAGTGAGAAPASGVATTAAIRWNEAQLTACRQRLLALRSKRTRPLRDEKILTDWNGLTIHALAVAAVQCDEPRYARLAAEAADFILSHLAKGRLRHRYRDGQVDAQAFLDDHAFLLLGLTSLFDATQDPRWLAPVRRVADALLQHFDTGAGFALTPDDGEPLPLRRVEAYDGAMPSGNSAAMEGLWRVGRLTAEARYDEAAWRTAAAFGTLLNSHPYGFTAMLCGLHAALEDPVEIVVAGPAAAAAPLVAEVRRGFHPERTLIAVSKPGPWPAWLSEYHARDGKATAYVCRDHACERPVHGPEELAWLLGGRRAGESSPDSARP
jgi:uncharacterized protein